MAGEVEYLPLGRPKGSRNKRTRELFDRLAKRGDLDPADLLSSIVTNEQESKELRVQAANMLLPYMHPKWQSVPVPQFGGDYQIQVPEFTSVEVAEKFLVEIAGLFASDVIPLDIADHYHKWTMGWIQSQYAKQGIDLKAQAQGDTGRDTVIRIENSLPQLPGCENLIMPTHEQINGKHYELPPPPSTLNPSSLDGLHTAESSAPSESIPTGNDAPASDQTETGGMIKP